MVLTTTLQNVFFQTYKLSTQLLNYPLSVCYIIQIYKFSVVSVVYCAFFKL